MAEGLVFIQFPFPCVKLRFSDDDDNDDDDNFVPGGGGD